MFNLDQWREVWVSVYKNKLRTILSGVTIMLALFIYIVLFGLANGLQNGFQEGFFDPSSFNISFWGGSTSMPYGGYQKGRSIEFKNKDYEYLKQTYKENIKHISSEYVQTLTAKRGSKSGLYMVYGVHPEYKYLSSNELIEGRFINENDYKSGSRFVVIGNHVVKDLFRGEDKKVVGERIEIGNAVYEIAGVFRSDDGDEAERIIYMSLSTLQKIYATQDITKIIISPKDELTIDDIKNFAENARSSLMRIHSVHPNDRTSIKLWDRSRFMVETSDFLLVLATIVFIIGSGSLVAGIVSIGNIMVFSVKERMKEIGIRKALGARPMNIISLILLESIMISLIFGIIGAILGSVFVESLGDSLVEYNIYDPGVSWLSIFFSGVILLLSGVFAGLIPSINATKINIIDALNDK